MYTEKQQENDSNYKLNHTNTEHSKHKRSLVGEEHVTVYAELLIVIDYRTYE